MGLELLSGCDSLNGTADMRALFRVRADIQTLSSAPYWFQRPVPGQLPNYGCAGIAPSFVRVPDSLSNRW